jgi:Ice-binding-like/Bacterial Ig-like domain
MKLLKTILLSLFAIGFIASCDKSDPTPTPTGPTVSSTNPANNATGVSRNNAITISFTEAMNPATINSSTVIVKQGNTVVPGTLTYSGLTAIFKPTDNLLALTVYTVTITTGAKTLAGNSISSNVVSSFTTGSTFSTLAAVNLGSAINYVILAKTAINNNPTSSITGALGLSPAATSYITGLALINATGYATSSQVTGNVYAADMATPTSSNLTTAVGSMETAYTDAAGRTLPDFVELATGNIGGRTLVPGLYKWTNTVLAPTSLTISGSATDVWIFQIAGDLTFSSAVNITLAGGALAKNIYWQVAGEVTVGTTAHVEGIFLSMTGITFQTGSSLNGRALAQTAVILDGNAIVQPL